MKARTIVTSLLALMLIVCTSLQTQAQEKNKYSDSFQTADASFKTDAVLFTPVVMYANSPASISAKRTDLFQAINHVRSESRLSPLVYQLDDQALANLRAETVSLSFVADTATCYAESVYRGDYNQIKAFALNVAKESNYQYSIPDATSMSVALYKAPDRDFYYAVVRLF